MAKHPGSHMASAKPEGSKASSAKQSTGGMHTGMPPSAKDKSGLSSIAQSTAKKLQNRNI